MKPCITLGFTLEPLVFCWKMLIIAFAAFQKPLQIGSRKPLNLSSENQADLVFQNHLFMESEWSKHSAPDTRHRRMADLHLRGPRSLIVIAESELRSPIFDAKVQARLRIAVVHD